MSVLYHTVTRIPYIIRNVIFFYFFFLFKSLSPENQTHTHVSRFEILEKSSVSHLKRVLENILQMTDRYRYEVERTIIFISLFRTD